MSEPIGFDEDVTVVSFRPFPFGPMPQTPAEALAERYAARVRRLDGTEFYDHPRGSDPTMHIQVADPNDPRLPLMNECHVITARLAQLQETCGCQGGDTCASCAPLVAERARLAMEYQALCEPIVLTAANADTAWWRSPVAGWAWQGDAAEMER